MGTTTSEAKRSDATAGAEALSAPNGLTKTDWLWLMALTLLALLVRLPGLGAESLWFDELCTWRFASYPTAAEVIQKGAIEDFHPPGYQLFMHFWMKVFGDSEAALRMPSALAGALSVPAIYLLGRKLLSRQTGLVAAVLLALTVTPVWRSQEARAYTVLLLLSIVTVSLWVDVCRAAFSGARISTWRVAALLISIVALMYAHYYGMFMAALEIGFFFVLTIVRRRRVVWAVGFSLFFLLALAPWAGGLRHHLGMQEGWIPRSDFMVALTGYLAFVYGSALEVGLVIMALSALALIAPQFGPFRANTSREQRMLWLLLTWLVVPFAIVVIKSAVSTPIFWPRYLIISMPAAALLSAHGLARLQTHPIVPAGIAAALAGLMWVFEEEHHGMVTKPQREGWREVTRMVIDRTPSQGSTAVVVLTEKPGVGDYYFRKLGGKPPDAHATDLEEAQRVFYSLAEKKPQYLWVMDAHPGVSGGMVAPILDSAAILANPAPVPTEPGMPADQFQVRGIRAYLFPIHHWELVQGARPQP